MKKILLGAGGGGVVSAVLVFVAIVLASHDPSRTEYDRGVAVAMSAAIAVLVAPFGAALGGLAGALASRLGPVGAAAVGAGVGLVVGGVLSTFVATSQGDFYATPMEVVPYLLAGTTAIGAATAAGARLIASRC